MHLKSISCSQHTEVRIIPRDLLFNRSSNVLDSAVSSSKFKLFTGGRFSVTVAYPVLSFTSVITSLSEALLQDRDPGTLSRATERTTDRNMMLTKMKK